ncbi:hypothetical protein Bca4012_064645 [Brassica carinata]|uniref:Pentatricopeptide repeat-containing protein n=1 Tax=Brassica carinata TaxID=52824 RepID=A0A8X8AXZ3_BRACI|nr:hypothetical protein Bca52824_017144 [Brassica carinata]
MKLSGLKPDNFTYNFVFVACGNLSEKIGIGRSVHSSLFKVGLDRDDHVNHSLIAMYAKCGRVVDARKVFGEITERDLVSWNSMISGYFIAVCANEAVGLFGKMEEEGFEPDERTLVSVLGGCANLGDLKTCGLVEEIAVRKKIGLSTFLGDDDDAKADEDDDENNSDDEDADDSEDEERQWWEFKSKHMDKVLFFKACYIFGRLVNLLMTLLESMSMFTTEKILHFISRHHMKWGDFITLCKELKRIKVACLKGEQRVRRPWWAPSCLSVVFVKAAKRNRQSRVVSLKLYSYHYSFAVYVRSCLSTLPVFLGLGLFVKMKVTYALGRKPKCCLALVKSCKGERKLWFVLSCIHEMLYQIYYQIWLLYRQLDISQLWSGFFQSHLP